MMNTRIGMTTMTRLLCTWDVEGMSAELYTLMQIAAALKPMDNDPSDDAEKKISNFILTLHFICKKENIGHILLSIFGKM